MRVQGAGIGTGWRTWLAGLAALAGVACGGGGTLPPAPASPPPAPAAELPASPGPEAPAPEAPASPPAQPAPEAAPVPVAPGVWAPGPVFGPTGDWSTARRGSWELTGASLAVREGRVLVNATVSQVLTMDDSETFMQSWLVEGGTWRALGGTTPSDGHWDTAHGVAWSAKGEPLRVRDFAGTLNVQRWDGSTWRDAVASVRLAHPPRCASLLSGPSGVVLAWVEDAGPYYAQGSTVHAARVDVGQGRLELLGEPLQPREGQQLYWCLDAQLDPSGHPVLAWAERPSASVDTKREAVRVVRWDGQAQRWSELPPAEDGTREITYPRLTVAADGVPVVTWSAWDSRELRSHRELRRYDAETERWVDLPTLPQIYVESLHSPSQGGLVACEWLACYRLVDGTWKAIEGAPSGERRTFANAVTSDAAGALYLLGLEGPRLGMPPGFEAEVAGLPALRVYRAAP